ncbi:hypothetical protein F5882DRAFT_297916, partial [Hyaloscypha sp. PMI_1271]
SHSHGWGTGPTDALTSWIVGLTVTGTGRSTWGLAPQFGDLTHAEAGFSTPLGKFSSAWTWVQGGYTVSWGAPAGTVGTVWFSLGCRLIQIFLLREEKKRSNWFM